MNPFLMPAGERLSAWRDFRTSLIELDSDVQLANVAKWVSQAPTVTYVLDCDQPQNWPSPWDLLNQGDFDDVAKAYLMTKTLFLIGWSPDRLKLAYIKNSKESFQTMILLVDGKWALNYSHADVINFDNEHPECAYLYRYSVNPEGGILQG